MQPTRLASVPPSLKVTHAGDAKMAGRSARFLSFLTLAALILLSGKLDGAGKAPAPATATPKLNAAGLAKFIDQQLSQRLKEEKVTASPLADDAEFLRRACLDLTGKIPSVERTLAFLNDTNPAKRAQLIDELLASSDYGRHQADLWQAMLLPRNSDVRFVKRDPLFNWLEESFNSNKPWNKLVHELVTASGGQDKNGAVTYFLTNNSVDKLNDSVARMFLGVQLQCAQCHNHPFTDWKQTDYWHMAAFFMKTQIEQVRNPNKGGGVPSVQEAGNIRKNKNFLPESAKILSPKFLQAEEPAVGGKALRPILADWLTSASNPYFSKAMVNRTWAQLFGRGLVNPIDDMHDGNPASHPELLAELSRQFAANDFDLKYVIRAICNSQSYQRTSKPYANNADASPALYSHMAVKVLSPEQLYDSLTTILGETRGAGPGPRAAAAARNGPATPRQTFVAFFMLEEPDPTEYQVGIPQVLRLMNSQMTNNNSSIGRVIREMKSPEEVVEQLYLSVLSRKPTAGEQEMMLSHVKKQIDPKTGYADILWAMLNSSEFALNR